MKTFAVLGGTTTRLAYLGDHLRLVGMKRNVGNGDPVPLTLAFVDAAGQALRGDARDVVVRGLLCRRRCRSPRDVPA